MAGSALSKDVNGWTVILTMVVILYVVACWRTKKDTPR